MSTSFDQYHSQGNRYFASGSFKDAIVQYTKALELLGYNETFDTPDSEMEVSTTTDGANVNEIQNTEGHTLNGPNDTVTAAALLFGNRSAAKLQLEQWEHALKDASKAVDINPTYAKGYLRKAIALWNLEDETAAVSSIERAHELEPGSKYIQDKLTHFKQKMAERDMSVTPTDLTHWKKLFSNVQYDTRLRLATLASLWNLAGNSVRFHVFGILVKLLISSGTAGSTFHPDSMPSEASIDDKVKYILNRYAEDDMIPLPMQNYEDVNVSKAWTDWFSDLDTTQKIEAFTICWDILSSEEKALVARDYEYFYQPERLQQIKAYAFATLAGETAGMDGPPTPPK